MNGYYSKSEIIEACRGLTGLCELVKRGDEWQHGYPMGNHAEIRTLSRKDFLFEQIDYSDVKEGVEYTNIAGGRMKVIRIDDAPNYLMPKRW